MAAFFPSVQHGFLEVFQMTDPKQHHYIPETYLENFCDKDGALWLYDKWDGRSFQSRPKNVLKEHFYYAQPDHEKKTWNHNIERFFSEKIETEWPSTVRLIQEGPDAVKRLTHFYMFLYAMRVRVPSCRKAIEYGLQQAARVVSASIRDEKFLDQERKAIAEINKSLNTNFKHAGDLYDAGVINITIDPHRSLLAMAEVAKGFASVVSALQLHFIKNCTPVDFHCSDNPVVLFPAGQQPHNCEPYQFRPAQPFEFIFPITKKYCLFHNSLKPIPAQQIVATETKELSLVRRINSFVGAFADRYVVSASKLEASELPTMNWCPRPIAYKLPQPRGTLLFLQFEMGEPLRLPKWKNKFEEGPRH
jgi:hypothetical protein